MTRTLPTPPPFTRSIKSSGNDRAVIAGEQAGYVKIETTAPITPGADVATTRAVNGRRGTPRSAHANGCNDARRRQRHFTDADRRGGQRDAAAHVGRGRIADSP